MAHFEQFHTAARFHDHARASKWMLRACAAVCVLLIATALHLWGAREIRCDPVSVFVYTIPGIVCLVFAGILFPWLGVDASRDAVERSNRAALVAHCGGLVAFSITFAAGNLGDGPDYSENVFSSGIAILALLALWIFLECATRVYLAIAEERDPGSGIRLCGFLIAASLILGRAVAGDWHSAADTLHDFARDGCPALVLLAVAVPTELALRPGRANPFPEWRLRGIAPALCYIVFSVAWLAHVGPWEGMWK